MAEAWSPDSCRCLGELLSQQEMQQEEELRMKRDVTEVDPLYSPPQLELAKADKRGEQGKKS